MSRPVLFIALLIAAFLVTGFYWANPRLERTKAYRQSVAENVELVDIPLTAQEQRRAEPARPQVPIGADNEAEIEEVSIDDTHLYDQGRVPVPAKIHSDAVAEEALTVNFWVLEEPPVLVREVPPKYPEIARRAGIEGGRQRQNAHRRGRPGPEGKRSERPPGLRPGGGRCGASERVHACSTERSPGSSEGCALVPFPTTLSDAPASFSAG